MADEALALIKMYKPISFGTAGEYDIILCRPAQNTEGPLRGITGLSWVDVGKDYDFTGSGDNIRFCIEAKNIAWCIYDSTSGALANGVSYWSAHPGFIDLT